MPNRKGRTQNSKRFVKNVKAIVQEELKDEIEEKHAITEYADVLCQRAIPSGAVTNGAGNFFKILPEIDHLHKELESPTALHLRPNSQTNQMFHLILHLLFGLLCLIC